MCGIAGFISPAGIATAEEAQALATRMADALRHRGPDATGLWVSQDRSVVLTHTRLSILDLSTNGNQPMSGRTGAQIVYNGELYNFASLKSRYPNELWRSTSDTEVLLRCYEEDGERSLDYFNGIFAFAVWDPHHEHLLLARDRAGVKPLYYTTLGGIFAFASEIKALLTLPWVTADLDEEALATFLAFNHVHAPATMFKGISKFHPGYTMVVERSGVRRYSQFWVPSWRTVMSEPGHDLQAVVIRELGESVKRQMISDVPVGVFLSGGVDSSGIVALASQHTSRPLTTYSVGFEGLPGYTELEYARTVSRQYKTNHIERSVRKEEISEFLPKMVEIYDEPLADATSIPIYFISQLARAHGTIVVLTGDGSDELFCGYRRWAGYARVLPWYRRYLLSPSWIRVAALRVYRWFDDSSAKYEFLCQAASGHEVYWGAGGFRESTRNTILSPGFLSRSGRMAEPYSLVKASRQAFRRAFPDPDMRSDVNWLCFNGFTDAVPNYYCYRADRMGMANSIEIRVPFPDNNVIDLAFSLPSSAKLNGGVPKAVLKKSLEPYLSREILYRRKMGFCVPIREWAGDVFIRYIDQHLKKFCTDTGLFREDGIRDLLRGNFAGEYDSAFGLWNLYFFMAWLRKWILRVE